MIFRVIAEAADECGFVGSLYPEATGTLAHFNQASTTNPFTTPERNGAHAKVLGLEIDQRGSRHQFQLGVERIESNSWH
jgi:hypothetical protein